MKKMSFLIISNLEFKVFYVAFLNEKTLRNM